MKGRLILIGLIAMLAGFVTVPKLYKMAQIRGALPGAKFEMVRVIEKWHPSPSERAKSGSAYWLLLREGNIRERGPHRTNVEREYWESLSVGSEIEIATVPGDSEAYLRHGIYASPGNFVFDLVLLALELGGIAVLATRRRLGSSALHVRPAA